MTRLISAILLTLAACAAARAAEPSTLENEFVAPPAAARPWVYWFWLNSNITKEGMTADLEAMKRVGIGGVLIMEVDQGAPQGPVAFAGPKWRDLYRHMLSEANRLGLEVNMNNDAGWCGSGGPWMPAELSMQYVVWTETNLDGGKHIDAALAEPGRTANYYRDITVLAFPTPTGSARIENINGKTGHDRQDQPPSPARYKELPADQVIKADTIVDLSANFKNGRLTWEAPAGKWTVLRIGHTSTGAVNAPAPVTGRGLECDKLSKEAVDAMFAGLMGKIIADSPKLAGKTLVTTHIDSWEVHSQNWTPRLRQEFQKRRGYDLFRYFPVYTGRVVESLEVSERFLWDLRQTISDLLVENYAGHFRELAQKNGLKLSIEAYGDAAFDDVTYAGHCDEPMGEFWSWAYGGAAESVTEMTSAGHVYGKRIIGAESFTATDAEKWQGHPGNIKTLGDWAFCEGINRFVFHRYALQPWLNCRPGMSMGPWGLHYERTQTWWEQSAAWHQYLARCQHLLRQGLFVADICYLQPEGAPRSFGPPVARRGNPPDRPAYNFDGCSPDVVLTRMSVKDGRIVLPDGMSYRLLALPNSQTMTPRLLAKIVELVEAGATVVGPRPQKSPALENYPACDDEVKKLADRLWGDCDGEKIKQHVLGKGSVVWGKSAEQVLAERKVPVDFSSDGGLNGKLRYIHRTLEDGTELYFVANKREVSVAGTCSFRVRGKRPAFWWPQSGLMQMAAAWQEKGGVTRVPLYLDAAESVFVVFRPEMGTTDPVVTMTVDGKSFPPAPPASTKAVVMKAVYGVRGDAQRIRDVKAKVQELIDADKTRLLVADMALGDDPAPNVVKTLDIDFKVAGKPLHVRGTDTEVIRLPNGLHGKTFAVQTATYGVPGDATRTRNVKAAVQKLVDEGSTSFEVASMAAGGDPAFGIVKTLTVEFTVDGKPHKASGQDPDVIELLPEAIINVQRPATLTGTGGSSVVLEAWQNGRFELTTASGGKLISTVHDLPAARVVAGPWQLKFPAGTAVPEQELPILSAWNLSGNDAMKYFSGTATYGKVLRIPAELLGDDRGLYLDLGRVAVMARVKLNGHDLGVLWKAPYRVEIDPFAKPGDNTLEIEVTNLWINRMIGDENLPLDSDRNGDGTLKAWPKWLLEGKSSPSGRQSFSSWQLYKKGEPLHESGLLGPVTLQATRRVVPQ
jgi:hypothetical protein